MYRFEFDRQRAEEIIAAIQGGKAKPVPAGGWSVPDMLHVAGTLYCAIWSRGPMTTDLERLDHMSAEYREAAEETLTKDVLGAIEVCGQLAMMVCDKSYDDQWQPYLEALLFHEAEGKRTIRFIDGAEPS